MIMAFAALSDNKRTWELIQLINPVNHGNDVASIEKYKAEPYVIAADVYTLPLHKGRGGWTWYTGAAGWLYQLLTESFIGLKREEDKLYFMPCMPTHWNSVKIKYRYIDTVYGIELVQSNENKVSKIWVDGKEETNDFITLINDGVEHEAKVIVEISNVDKPDFQK